MTLTTVRNPVPRPPSPWSGSQHETRHRWQLDLVASLADAAEELRKLADELTAAHAAGWWLVEPMRSGHLLAARASRRQRAQRAAASMPPVSGLRPVAHRWRLRVFAAAGAVRTPVLAWTGCSLEQVGGPDLPGGVLAQVAAQVAPQDLAARRWGVAAARVGLNVDLVADGSALRLHAVVAGVLVRTSEVLTFQHAADGAATLLEAADAYGRLAGEAEAMAAIGGRLAGADEGFLHVVYDLAVA